jgi:hypothetical protein
VLDDPARVVARRLEVLAQSDLPVADALVTALRVGQAAAQRHAPGLRGEGAVTIQTSTLAATRDRPSAWCSTSTLRERKLRNRVRHARAHRWRSARACASESGRDIIIAVDAATAAWIPVHPVARHAREGRGAGDRARWPPHQPGAGMKAVLTRDGDYFISLRERNLRAQKARRICSSRSTPIRSRIPTCRARRCTCSPSAAHHEQARWLAERENAADLMGGIELDDKDRCCGVLIDLSQTASISPACGRGQRAQVARSHRRSAQAARAAGGIRGAQVAGDSVHAGGDRVHLEPRG